MKKGVKIALALAAAAALTPYSIRKDEAGNPTVRALLWEYSSGPDPKEPGKRLISINVGFPKSSEEKPAVPAEPTVEVPAVPTVEVPAGPTVEVPAGPTVEAPAANPCSDSQ